jgi:hypothetical protein
MWKIRKWFERKSVSKKEYEAEKREFEMAIGKPFLKLENNEDFLDEVKDLIKKNLLLKRENQETLATDN